MTKKTLFAASLAALSLTTANAGGLLTNTNQSIAFLRNPARDASIAIDGVYSNPAGVALLPEGFHVGVNWQMAVQTRTVETTSPVLDRTLKATSADAPTRRYRGHASAPCIPSVGAAYNKGKLSYQFNFAVAGGGGKCEFSKGIGTFDNAVGTIAKTIKTSLDPTVNGYDVDNYMEGRQFYYGITMGAAYKVIDKKDMKLSVYGGLRGLIASASYEANINDILISNSNGLEKFSDFVDRKVTPTLNYVNQNIAAIEAAMGDKASQHPQYATLVGTRTQLNALESYKNGLNLHSDQKGFGVAPLFSVDFQYKRFNVAAKYEFRTKMSLKNESNLEAATIDATKQFLNGSKVREDSPALLTVGAQYSPVDIVRISAGYHHFYDRKSKKFGDKQELLAHGTNEYLGGVEVDCTDRLIVSAGAQITRYGNTDAYISDLSFSTNSWSFGFGASYQANPNVKIEAAYFRTMYDHYTTATSAAGITNDFTRTNDVIGVGLVMNF